MRCDAGTWPQPWAAHKGHFRALKLRFEMRQRTFNKWQMLSAYASLCLRVCVCLCLCVYVCVWWAYTLQLLSEHQSNASFPVDFISRLCEVCQKCVVSCPTIFWPAYTL